MWNVMLASMELGRAKVETTSAQPWDNVGTTPFVFLVKNSSFYVLRASFVIEFKFSAAIDLL